MTGFNPYKVEFGGDVGRPTAESGALGSSTVCLHTNILPSAPHSVNKSAFGKVYADIINPIAARKKSKINKPTLVNFGSTTIPPINKSPDQ